MEWDFSVFLRIYLYEELLKHYSHEVNLDFSELKSINKFLRILYDFFIK